MSSTTAKAIRPFSAASCPDEICDARRASTSRTATGCPGFPSGHIAAATGLLLALPARTRRYRMLPTSGVTAAIASATIAAG